MNVNKIISFSPAAFLLLFFWHFKGTVHPQSKITYFSPYSSNINCVCFGDIRCLSSLQYNGTRWHCGAQTAQITHLKNSTAMFLSRHHGPITQNILQTLWKNYSLSTKLSLHRKMRAPAHGGEVHACDSMGCKQ